MRHPPKIQRSPKLHEEIKENIVKTKNLNQKEVNMQKEGDSQTKIYIKEVTYTENKNEGSPEKSNIRYIALKKEKIKMLMRKILNLKMNNLQIVENIHKKRNQQKILKINNKNLNYNLKKNIMNQN